MQANETNALRVRPNTALPEAFFQRDLVICTGEDSGELAEAIQRVLPGKRSQFHQYRCYQAWKFQDPEFTLILSGIGTGCLEPLMFEILDAKTLGDKVPKRLAMIGTAGYLSDSGFGQVYLVDGAYPVGCAVSLHEEDLPVRPKFAGLDKVELLHAEEISSDYYYGNTTQMTDLRKVKSKYFNQGLRNGLDKYWQPGRLISMETAQFYHFANIYGSEDTEYVAFRGVANLADQFETQGDYSVEVLTEALRQAVGLLSGCVPGKAGLASESFHVYWPANQNLSQTYSTYTEILQCGHCSA